MKHEKVYLSDDNSDIISFALSQHGSTNRAERDRMKKILLRAIRHELTDRQRDCLTMYYLEGIKMKDIAVMLNLSNSTVSRHIHSATRKLRRVASYYRRY